MGHPDFRVKGKILRLAAATRSALGAALGTAWRNVAPRALVAAEAEAPSPRKGRRRQPKEARE